MNKYLSIIVVFLHRETGEVVLTYLSLVELVDCNIQTITL